METAQVHASISKNELISALRSITINRDSFDPAGWAIGDAEDLEMIARMIRREIAEADKSRTSVKLC